MSITALDTPTARADGERRERRTIVVAVDGSQASLAALGWARDMIDASGDRLRVVTAYSSPLAVAEVPITADDLRQARDMAHADAVAAVARVFGARTASTEIEHVVAAGSIDRVLERSADGAHLVVLGTRSRRRWRDRVRPSTTNRITGRLDCPIVSIPESAADAGLQHPVPPAATSSG